ncbi:MAG: tRNA epoxyqueuosine(34) reductase QueG [Terracidiphilus sp.]
MFSVLCRPSSSAEASLPPVASVRLSSEQARALALDAGFTEAGLIALPYDHQQRDAERFAEWVEAGRAGSMSYLERREAVPEGEPSGRREGRLVRSRVSIPFPWARSALVCWASYNSPPPRSTAPADPGTGWIARYAWSGRPKMPVAGKISAGGQPATNPALRASDYHKVLMKRLKAVEARLHEQWGAFEARAFVDTGPLVERALAVAAGLGWIGKNTCLIHPRLGSYGFLAVLLTSLELREGDTHALQPGRCGSCRRCLDACPTGALTAPYQMDATRCIAYLTIEHRGPITPEFAEGAGRQVFGCDICQDVCPWNRKAPRASDPDLQPRLELVNPALEWLGSLEEKSFERLFNGSPVRRAGFSGFQRNVAIAMGNSRLDRFIPRLELWSEAADSGLRAAARWALQRIRAV